MYVDDRFHVSCFKPDIKINRGSLILDLSKCTQTKAHQILKRFSPVEGVLLVNPVYCEGMYERYLLQYLREERIDRVLSYFKVAFKPFTDSFLNVTIPTICNVCRMLKAHSSTSLDYYKSGDIKSALLSVWADIDERTRPSKSSMLLLVNTIDLLSSSPNFPPSVSERVMKAVDNIFKFSGVIYVD